MSQIKYLAICCLSAVSNAFANGGVDTSNVQSVYPQDLSLPELIRQDQRLADLKQYLDTQTIIQPTERNLLSNQLIIIKEEPCFNIQKIEISTGDSGVKVLDAFSFLMKTLNKKSSAIVGQCIGTQSLQNIVRFAQNELIKKGFVTTQIVVPEQDMTEGILSFQVVPGRISQIIHQGPQISQIQLNTAFPFKDGDILNIRDLDQALENLKKVSGLDVDIQIEANGESSTAGQSNIVVTTQPYKKANLSLSVDDSGNKSTGRYIGNIGVSLNNPLRLNDSLNLNFSHSLDNIHQDRNKSYFASYQLPFQTFDLSAAYNWYEYDQYVAGYEKPILYSGESQQANVTLSKMLLRGTQYKTSVYGKVYQKQNRNYIEDIEIGVQRRRTAGWHVGIQHKHYVGNTLFDAALDYRRGIGAFNALAAPEEKITDIYGNPLPVEGYSRAPLWSADLRINYPFVLLNQAAQYRINWKGQYAPKVLVPQDRFYIGGRYSVRGFDGEIMLSGDNGHFLQQEINVNLPFNNQLYVGVDQGWVGGEHSIAGQRYLAGGVAGIRTYYHGLYLDAFAGHGLVAPNNMKREISTGFSLSYSY
ncbi:ShlB/FhaC/HecB family hemolysin secretion/activation protein [Acinetobacter sp. YH12023]|uniref:ShlB/FhaC/HecB family hemolysin secretion/activation protein n=1 Tax=Acinetobacter sp. YH12023 TaxID=2601041 RepID=UPI0015D29CD1|nr:ShlB/FhaC/HecB family hemolysin secretion/activation protein [Acinetobacter sp. YH12023]